MWEDIALSLGMSLAESIGCKYIDAKKKKSMLKRIESIVKQECDRFADSSLDCNDFYMLTKERGFVEIMRNLFLTIDDGLARGQYFENLERYIYNRCSGVKHYEVRDFLRQIEELYKNYLHKIIEDYPGSYALFQLITISHREIISKMLGSEQNIKKYFENVDNKNIMIDDDNIRLFHEISEKEYSIIRFTGISVAERKKNNI